MSCLLAGSVIAEPGSSYSVDYARNYERAILSAERQRGPYAPGLVDLLQSLGRQLQEDGRHDEAVRQYRRALHLTRVNGGLYEPGQIPLLQQLAFSQTALGLLDQADGTHDYLYRIQRQVYQPGSELFSEAITAHAEWKRQAYLQGAGGESYLQLLNMHKAHSRAAADIAVGDEYSLAQLPHLYGSLRSQYLISTYDGGGTQRGLSFSTPGYAGSTSLEAEEFRLLKKHNFRNGRRTLERAIDVLEHQDPVDVAELARAKAALGDWFLWWHQSARGLQSYREAYRLLADDGDPRTDPMMLFREPLRLPADGVFRHSGEPRGKAAATVRFRVSRLGDAQAIEVLDVEVPSEREARVARVVLYNQMRDYRFRPVVRDGEVVVSEVVERDYRFDY